MPYPSEHSCRLHDPGLYDEESFRRIKRGDVVIIIGKRKGKQKTEAQAYRYPVGEWTEKKARAHCKENEGQFEAASKEEKMFDAIEIEGVEVSVEELVEAYKKSFSLDEERRVVWAAWEATFRTRRKVPTAEIDSYWVKEIFDDQVIVETPDGLYSYPYSTNDEGGIEFGEPVKVKVMYQPITASKAMAVKMLREEDGGVVVGGHLVLWGDAEAKDLQGEYFTPETELWLDVYKSVPALFHHGLDDVVGLAAMGHRVKAEADETGMWVEDWLDTSNEYWAWVEPLLEAERLFYSPGSASHLVKRAEDGRLLSFPVVEDTLTPVPAQHRLRPVNEIRAAYKAAGMEMPQGLEPERPDSHGDGAGASCVEALTVRARAVLVELEVDE